MNLATGTRLGPYELLCPIGSGGIGEVHRARDPRPGRGLGYRFLVDTGVSVALSLPLRVVVSWTTELAKK
jgi:hypothetical protein